MTAFGASAKMQPPSAQSQAFDATCSAWLGRWVDTIPLGFHRLLSDFLLLQLLLIDGRTKGALFDSLKLNGFWPGLQDWFQIWFVASSSRRTRSPQMLSSVCRLAVSDARLALPNFYNITIRIANVAARLAVFGLWLGEKLGSSASP